MPIAAQQGIQKQSSIERRGAKKVSDEHPGNV
jgi:hypothetical protein